jgi:predicted dehydrogenase
MNPTIKAIGRKLRLGMIGGGPGSFIGEVHRIAARMDDRYALVATMLSSNPQKSKEAGISLGITSDRAYSTADELFKKESDREDQIDVLAIMTPNDSHYALSCRTIEKQWAIICDKPLTTKLDDAIDLVKKVNDSNTIFCQTFNYTGYPLVRHAREMVRNGDLGDIHMVKVEYIQGHNATLHEAEETENPHWKMFPEKVGPSVVLGDIGTHAHHLTRFITGEEVVRVCADVGAVVPGREFDDYAGVLIRLENGARGTMFITQAGAGAEHGLNIRVFGSKGTIEWHQERAGQMIYTPIASPMQLIKRDGPGMYPAAKRAIRVSFGHPEAFYEAFANLYKDTADAITAKMNGKPLSTDEIEFPTVEDGAKGVKFVEACKESTQNGSVWTDSVLDV